MITLREIKFGSFSLLLILIMISKTSTTICYGEEAWIEDFNSPFSARIGSMINVTFTIGYDFGQETEISPGIWNIKEEIFEIKEYYFVSGKGTTDFNLSFRAPTYPGEYIYEANVFYYDDEWLIGGIDAYLNFTIQVTNGIDVTQYYAKVVDVQAESRVKPLSSTQVKITINYNLPKDTMISIGILDYDTEEILSQRFETVSGEKTETYFLDLNTPAELGTYDFFTNVVYLLNDEWLYVSDGGEIFSLEVVQGGESRGIPGFPIYSIIISIIISMTILQKHRH
jgi:hypothetical protein